MKKVLFSIVSFLLVLMLIGSAIAEPVDLEIDSEDVELDVIAKEFDDFVREIDALIIDRSKNYYDSRESKEIESNKDLELSNNIFITKNTTDYTGPTIHSVDMPSKTVTAGESFTVTATVSDDSGVSWGYVQVMNTLTDATQHTSRHRIDFTKKDDTTWIATFNVDTNWLEGEYALFEIYFTDAIGNYSQELPYAILSDKYPNTVNVVNTQTDCSGPTIHSVDMPSKTVTAGESFTVTATVSDDSGVSWGYVQVMNTLTDATQHTSRHRIDFTKKDDTTWIATFNVDTNWLEGEYALFEIYFTDAIGNYSQELPYAILSDKYPNTVKVVSSFPSPTNESLPTVTPTLTAMPNPTLTPMPTPTATPTPTVTPKINLSKCKVTVKNQTYTGKALMPTITVKYGKKALKKGTDYTVSYKNSKTIGTATVTVKGKGKYTGTAEATFKINPKAIAISKLIAGKTQFTVKWKKQTGITGYQIEYSLKMNFANSKKVTVKKAKTVSATIKKLKAGKKYYVRIRTYKVVKKKNYYSAWSKAQAVTIQE